jgi:hypothetical protein
MPIASLPSRASRRALTPRPTWRASRVFALAFRCVGAGAVLAFLAGCATAPKTTPAEELTPGDPSAPSQVTPREALDIARQLTDHPWQPFAKNILHGKDKVGILVNTPDAGYKDQPERPGWWLPGVVNLGIPYKWGGFDDPASFDSAIARGLGAGDVSSPEKRRLDNAAVSAQAAGVDCSGFVSRCLKLPSVFDSRQLPSVCSALPSVQNLHPGDLLNIPHRHVLLCAGWATPDRQSIYFYETGGAPDYWKPGLKQASLDRLLALGYQPLRYRGMATSAQTEGKQVLTRAVRTAATVVANPLVGEP